jgi:hypothetical protein
MRKGPIEGFGRRDLTALSSELGCTGSGMRNNLADIAPHASHFSLCRLE